MHNRKILLQRGYRRFSSTSGFTQAGVYARRQFCGNLEVYRPHEPLWNPRLREAAPPLAVMRGQQHPN